MNTSPKMPYRCAVMGNPIAHSQSPAIHAQFAKAQQIELIYDKILVPIDGFAAAVTDFFATGGLGLNVTLPFKPEAFALVDRPALAAQYAGAVNTIYQKDGVLVGENTDGVGLVKALEITHGHSLKNKSVLLLGAGGAARGAVYPLLQAGISNLLIANRSVDKAQAIVAAHEAVADNRLSATSINTISAQPFDFIINATSAGLTGDMPALPETIIKTDSICYDMVYGTTTPFMHWASSKHCANVYDGYSMLVAQARISFRHWFGL